MPGSGCDVAVLCGAVCQRRPRLVDYSRAVRWCAAVHGVWAGSPVLVARDGEPCGRQRTVRGDRGGGLRAHRRTDLAVAGQRDHRLHRGPFDRGDSRRHGDSAVVSTVLGDVGAGRVVVRQCGDYGHHLHVVGIVDAGEPGDARWRDSCGRLCGRSLFAGFHQCLAGRNSLRIRTCSILLPACCARVRCRLC